MIGFPSLAATSMEQGRLAARAACGEPAGHAPELLPFAELLPFGIYKIDALARVATR